MMTAKEALTNYDLLWGELRAAHRLVGKKNPVYRRPRAEIVADMIAHCGQAMLLYADGCDPWRLCMWERRLYLHQTDQHHLVYTNNNPIEWKRRMRAKNSHAEVA